jgi:hypothetical protein
MKKIAEIARLREQNKKSGMENSSTKLNEKNAEIARLKEEPEKVASDLVFWR